MHVLNMQSRIGISRIQNFRRTHITAHKFRLNSLRIPIDAAPKRRLTRQGLSPIGEGLPPRLSLGLPTGDRAVKFAVISHRHLSETHFLIWHMVLSGSLFAQ